MPTQILPGKSVLHKKLGMWQVNGKFYNNKLEALFEASKNGAKVSYHYYDGIFSKVDVSKLGNIYLHDLYRQRAQQIRDEYDYLILYYSGGADSWNVLNTFLSNNIKLDCVYVRWPLKANEYHSFNKQDVSAYNFLSEWRYAIEPDLKWLSNAHPEIKIIVDDWSYTCNSDYYTTDRMQANNHMYSASSLIRMQTFSDYEINLVDKGYKVAEIWGIDKPLISIQDKHIGFKFRDSSISTGNPYIGNIDGLEFFYWTPKMPNIVYEQTYKIIEYLQSNPQFKSLLWSKGKTYNFDDETYFSCLIKPIIYPGWNNSRFQADKPQSPWREDKDYWLYKFNDFKSGVESWKSIYNDMISNIDPKFCRINEGDNMKTGVSFINSKFYRVCRLDSL